MELPISSLSFTVRRREPELITPAKPTPREFKLLSDIDDQEGLRFQVPAIHFYRNDQSMRRENMDPVKVIREALAQTLVFYYPFAGRLREMAGRKLVVECTGEGVMFIEADADVRLEDFGDDLHPPFPCFEELLFDVPGSGGILNCPLLLIQILLLRPDRCRTRALRPDPAEELCVLCPVDARAKFNPPLPVGYYGNAFAFSATLTTAEKLCQNPLGYALELVSKIKGKVTEEYVRSAAELLVMKGRPQFRSVGTFIASVVTRAGFEDVDFGWGEAVYSGPTGRGVGDVPGFVIFCIRLKKKNAEDGIVVPICLPALVMDRFVTELDSMLKEYDHHLVNNNTPPNMLSPL